MRSLRMWLVVAMTLLVVVSIAQAKTNYAYVTNWSANSVSVINTSNGALVKTIPVGTNPWGVAVNQAGTFAYAPHLSSNSVSVISTSTNAMVTPIPVGASAATFALAPNGNPPDVPNLRFNAGS